MKQLTRGIIYLAGLAILALGITLNTKTGLRSIADHCGRLCGFGALGYRFWKHRAFVVLRVRPCGDRAAWHEDTRQGTDAKGDTGRAPDPESGGWDRPDDLGCQWERSR